MGVDRSCLCKESAKNYSENTSQRIFYAEVKLQQKLEKSL